VGVSVCSLGVLHLLSSATVCWGLLHPGRAATLLQGTQYPHASFLCQLLEWRAKGFISLVPPAVTLCCAVLCALQAVCGGSSRGAAAYEELV
jgi:hypothetical protein